jgi:catechol 2,3-dioxygenase-like lactoylglutathione lyase family enzyme
MKFICPLITVNDISRSREFYEKVLNQKVKYDFGENISFEGDFSIHLKSHFQKLIGNKEIKTQSNNFELYFEYDDLEQIVEKLKDYGVTFIHPITEQPWRQKVVRFYDPDDYIIEIGESLEYLCHRLHQEGKPVHEIACVTYIPEEFVRKSIESFSKLV